MAMFRSARRLPLAVAVVGAVTLGLLAPVAAADVQFEPGVPGLGDPYFPDLGNGGYDVEDYHVKMAYEADTGAINATTTINATATQDLSRFDLDLYKLNVRSVQVDGETAGFARTGERELVITPREGLRKQSAFTVVVRYDGIPEALRGPISSGRPYGFVRTGNGATIISQPDGASTWFPSNDHPRDKAFFTVETTVRQGLQVVGNGRLVQQPRGEDTDTFVWTEDSPMATYLVTNSIGRFDTTTSTTSELISQLDAVNSGIASDPAAARTRAWTKAAVDGISPLFGFYPFDTTGSIIENNDVPPLNLKGALATQTRPTYQSPPTEADVARAIGYQWFGASVTPARWSDVWLGDGLATWTEKFWAERNGGPSAQEAFKRIYDDPPTVPPGRPGFWDIAVADPSRDQMFHPAVALRGGMAFQALRHMIGESRCAELTRAWLSRNEYGTATTEDFEALAQQITGRDLRDFFKVWLHTAAKPPAGWWGVDSAIRTERAGRWPNHRLPSRPAAVRAGDGSEAIHGGKLADHAVDDAEWAGARGAVPVGPGGAELPRGLTGRRRGPDGW
ncbi:M1 family metallopeptidase [Actinomadura terrae]|uniref:M1 family metallopeptidase n=1 Tax=Actinomadura terrae TaxID=604353 RepID=UPI001FA6D30F|nr:M1 family metallopeptidase [Actinomadura terrae]